MALAAGTRLTGTLAEIYKRQDEGICPRFEVAAPGHLKAILNKNLSNSAGERTVSDSGKSGIATETARRMMSFVQNGTGLWVWRSRKRISDVAGETSTAQIPGFSRPDISC